MLAAVVSHGGPWLVVGDFSCQLAQLTEAMGPTQEKTGAVILAPDCPTHYQGGDAAPAVLGFCIIDD